MATIWYQGKGARRCVCLWGGTVRLQKLPFLSGFSHDQGSNFLDTTREQKPELPKPLSSRALLMHFPPFPPPPSHPAPQRPRKPTSPSEEPPHQERKQNGAFPALPAPPHGPKPGPRGRLHGYAQVVEAGVRQAGRTHRQGTSPQHHTPRLLFPLHPPHPTHPTHRSRCRRLSKSSSSPSSKTSPPSCGPATGAAGRARLARPSSWRTAECDGRMWSTSGSCGNSGIREEGLERETERDG